MKKNNRRAKKREYTYPELLERYFPGDEYKVEEVTDTSDSGSNRDTLFDILERVNRPIGNHSTKATKEISQ